MTSAACIFRVWRVGERTQEEDEETARVAVWRVILSRATTRIGPLLSRELRAPTRRTLKFRKRARLCYGGPRSLSKLDPERLDMTGNRVPGLFVRRHFEQCAKVCHPTSEDVPLGPSFECVSGRFHPLTISRSCITVNFSTDAPKTDKGLPNDPADGRSEDEATPSREPH
jgi:hypothetical protein